MTLFRSIWRVRWRISLRQLCLVRPGNLLSSWPSRRRRSRRKRAFGNHPWRLQTKISKGSQRMTLSSGAVQWRPLQSSTRTPSIACRLQQHRYLTRQTYSRRLRDWRRSKAKSHPCVSWTPTAAINRSPMVSVAATRRSGWWWQGRRLSARLRANCGAFLKMQNANWPASSSVMIKVVLYSLTRAKCLYQSPRKSISWPDTSSLSRWTDPSILTYETTFACEPNNCKL